MSARRVCNWVHARHSFIPIFGDYWEPGLVHADPDIVHICYPAVESVSENLTTRRIVITKDGWGQIQRTPTGWGEL